MTYQMKIIFNNPCHIELMLLIHLRVGLVRSLSQMKIHSTHPLAHVTPAVRKTAQLEIVQERT